MNFLAEAGGGGIVEGVCVEPRIVNGFSSANKALSKIGGFRKYGFGVWLSIFTVSVFLSEG